jgi:hypothetical protein
MTISPLKSEDRRVVTQKIEDVGQKAEPIQIERLTLARRELKQPSGHVSVFVSSYDGFYQFHWSSDAILNDCDKH